ncbi:uncharacterized protein PHALS_13950 [Plasmopara halstedii]|uniref:Uncharacterized protein n=1 Tax=Plasmopara halstedii TaxID=4781 RepID=A0A0P1ART0_PLAHL|nr:uncharacterized protein PHALS_13950 [Plasmopara halstedii]CEG43652.1 hypothetical protein PHALS_13950 [Plasmopara halstedii]|eukprot:XP_024580021.1 hypothetical protein PHALS_13950 [Plasmopara halstedii]
MLHDAIAERCFFVDDDEEEESDAVTRLQNDWKNMPMRAAETQREKARRKLQREICTIDGVNGDCILSEGKGDRSAAEESNVVKMNKLIKVVFKMVVVTEQDKAVVANALAGGAILTEVVSMTTGISARESKAIAIDHVKGSNGAKTDSEDIDTELAVEGEKFLWLSSITSKRKRNRKNMTVQANKEPKERALARQKRSEHVLIIQRKKAAKFMSKDVPYPFYRKTRVRGGDTQSSGQHLERFLGDKCTDSSEYHEFASKTIVPLSFSKKDCKLAKKELNLIHKA